MYNTSQRLNKKLSPLEKSHAYGLCDDEHYKPSSEKIKHYNGVLGEFSYDSNQFAVLHSEEYGEHLKYIGDETDGSNINIPYGVQSCKGMFADNQKLITPPAIPDTVIDSESMFANCRNLKCITATGKNITIADRMYDCCFSLDYDSKRDGKLPDSIRSCEYMFNGCMNAQCLPDVPDGAYFCNFMYAKCLSLKQAPKISKYVRECCGTFLECAGMTEPPVIPNNVIKCNQMFSGCTSLEKSPNVPFGVRECDFMFYNCKSLTELPVFPSSVYTKNGALDTYDFNKHDFRVAQANDLCPDSFDDSHSNEFYLEEF